MSKQELMEYKMQVENEYDTLVNIQENRNISYGEIAFIEGLRTKKQIEEFENEIIEEIDRIINVLKNSGYIE